MRRRRWAPDDDAVLRARYPHELTAAIARDLGVDERRVYARAHKLGLRKSPAFLASAAAHRLSGKHPNSVAHQFKKGLIPANKGLRRPGWYAGRMRETQFKKGRPAQEARNYLPVGSLRLSKDGYLERKVTDDPALVPARRWVFVHRLVWEAAHGPVPAGFAVVFLPGRFSADVSAITADALELITRAELMRRNSYHTRYPKEIGLAIQARGALVRQINRRMRDEKQD